ncbi:PAS and ANTAR domain-containing protein [Nocardia gipuzkoensis]|uniref:PAS and ANTAR domain-containing protein n=1 Tax=Nocardia gipuzkoensis TaxID=2749991 RepID=UPI001F30458A|nr:PAS and ANTAR domain-containing protein [Nocardia gipuzkoensis]
MTTLPAGSDSDGAGQNTHAPGSTGTRDLVVGASRAVDARVTMKTVDLGNGSQAQSDGNGRQGLETIGSFRFWFADQRWEWSEQVARLHGYAPGTVEPTTELLLAHKHPDDRATVAETLATAVRTGEPFCSRHRIIDLAGRVHHVLVVGDRLHDSTGATVGTTGYYVDLTGRLDENRQKVLQETLPEVVAAREVIEQAKGILMFVYGVNAEQAFGVLQWRSQETNTKLRDLAAKLVAAVVALGGGPVRQRTQFDHLLLTVHERPDRT